MTLTSLRAHDPAGSRVAAKRLTAGRVLRATLDLLSDSPLCAIATTGRDGRSHINTAYFAYSDSLELFFLSHPESLHCRNLRTTPTVAVAVYESNQRWGERDRGLQLFGTCREATGANARRAERLYLRRFRVYAKWVMDGDRDDVETEYRFYRIVITRLKVFDEPEFGGAVFITASVRR